jgi:hypothetical protein
MIYEVIVGNIGSVIATGRLEDARKRYQIYVEQSQSGRGRAGGENVTLLGDGEIVEEFIGTLNEEGEVEA